MKPLRSDFGIRKTETFYISLLITSWIAGSVLALFVSKQTSFSLMYPLRVERVSIVGMIVSLIFPITLSYILLNRCCFYTIIPVIALKAFFYMYCFYAITCSFGTAGWLVRILLLFSDTFSVIFLLIYCYRFAAGNRNDMLRLYQIMLLFLILVGSLDYYVISPFIMMLINY